MDDRLLKNVQKTFSMYGLTITRNLSSSVVKYLGTIEENKRESVLTEIIEKILCQNLQNPNVEAKSLKSAITDYHRSLKSVQETETVFRVIETHEIPKVTYDLEKEKFVLTKAEEDLLPNADHKPFLYEKRFELLWYRTSQHELFSPPKFGEAKNSKRKLFQIEYLNSASVTGLVDVMGLLVQITEGQFYLEDPTGIVKLDLKKTFDTGLMVEGTIVLTNGYYEDDMLRVIEMGLPPVEDKSDSLAVFGNANTFGGPSTTSLRTSIFLQSHEDSNPDSMIVFLSNFWVDNLTVLKRFQTMIEEYNNFPPVAFVICGHFLSNPLDVTSARKLQEGFRHLAEIISQYENILTHSKFVFVPGMHDLSAAKILPRPPLPACIMKHFSSVVPGTILAPNPCRIQYCTKEIVVMRENMLSKLCRNTVHFPQHGKAYEHFAQTIIAESHLTPFMLPLLPIYWKNDHVLQLYPTPDLIVVADEFQPYSTKFGDCHVINPGSFPNNNFSFMNYIPYRNKIEDCSIPVDDE